MGFIGEEFDKGVPTSASLILPKNWNIIDMPAEERHRRQIPDDYTCDRYTPDREVDGVVSGNGTCSKNLDDTLAVQLAPW